MPLSKNWLAALGAAHLCLAPLAALAQATPPPDAKDKPVQVAQGDIIVFGRAERQIGVADAATAGSVGGADLTTRPILRVAQLLEVVPGMIAAQHSGSGKANQYFLRGINLDHGTDFTTYFDGVPMNFRSHGHGQGYMDLNGIIPETVNRVDFRKGPYRADVGDFALAGQAFLGTVKRFDAPFVTIEGGSYNHQRLVAGGSTQWAGGELTGAAQVKTYDGPWQLAEKLQHGSLYAKYTHPLFEGDLTLSLSGYYGRWRPTEQIPERAIGRRFVGEGHDITCADAYCAIDPTARGQTSRWIATAGYEDSKWRVNSYAQYYDWRMSSNPTFFLDDPTNGDQIFQHDRRTTYGGRIERHTDMMDSALTLRFGAETRYDDIPNVGVDHTVANKLIAIIAKNAVKEASVSPYTEAEWRVNDKLRVNGGLRYDFYNYDVKALDPGSSQGDKNDAMLSPSVGAAYRLTDDLEFYANWGRGLHSNDARGVVQAVNPVPGLTKGEGKELGARLQHGALTLTGAYWWLDSDSELRFVGDSNSVEPAGASKREGYELTAFWRPFAWLALDGQWTQSQARYVDAPGADHIPGALEQAGELGISCIWEHWEASARVRYVGPYALIEDDSVRAKAEQELSLRAAWKPSGKLMVFAEVLNALDHKGKDIQYFYTSRLPGEPAGGIDDIVARAHEPRTFRIGVTKRF
ncbi:MAG TPA: TonB-dependent receptor [Caulobacterales bacterium]|nr:TonB-dependent receptor [Caulobacterales bacterium]